MNKNEPKIKERISPRLIGRRPKNKNKKFLKIIFTILVFSFTLSPLITRALPSLDEILKDLQDNKNALNQEKSKATDIQSQLNTINSDLSLTQTKIGSLSQSIGSKEAEIKRLDNEIKVSIERISKNKEDLKKLIQLLYEKGNLTSVEIIASTTSITNFLNQEEYSRSVQEKVNSTIGEIKGLKSQMEGQKANQEAQKKELENQKAVLDQERARQAAQKSVQDTLLAKSKNKQATIQQNIANLTRDANAARSSAFNGGSGGYSNGGGDLVIVNRSPHYYQTNYPGNIGGSTSSIASYGCALTSLAMVATAAGHPISPATVAANRSIFNWDLIRWGDAADFVGLNYLGGTSNTGSIDSYLSQGYFVIAKVYVVSRYYTGTHYVWIVGKSGEKYQVNDPAFGSGGYSFSQVKALQIFR